MDEKKFSVGDVVILKSGGPDMTIIKTEGLGEKCVECKWFDEHNKLHKEKFSKEELDSVEEIYKNNMDVFNKCNK